MKVKIRYNHWYPGCIGRRAIVLYPYILIGLSPEETKEQGLLAHEWIHIQQIRRQGIFIFYVMYIYEWLINLWKYRNTEKAYKNISYEKEAYDNQDSFILPENLV
ncbi:MAG: hypothetical protein NTX91_05205 [candidate division SR1 bacterium]|nr:hypothetical protein [candidate division SR1 bacterium]